MEGCAHARVVAVGKKATLVTRGQRANDRYPIGGEVWPTGLAGRGSVMGGEYHGDVYRLSPLTHGTGHTPCPGP